MSSQQTIILRNIIMFWKKKYTTHIVKYTKLTIGFSNNTYDHIINKYYPGEMAWYSFTYWFEHSDINSTFIIDNNINNNRYGVVKKDIINFIITTFDVEEIIKG